MWRLCHCNTFITPVLPPLSVSAPRSVSVTFATKGPDRGKVVRLVTDMVLDRRAGNTDGLSGVAAAAAAGGASPARGLGALAYLPPLVALARALKGGDGGGGYDGAAAAPPFPEAVLIQLAEGVAASDLGRSDPRLLAEDFEYVEPLRGPLGKEEYLRAFTEEYDVREGMAELDYGYEVSARQRSYVQRVHQ